jgi:DNA-binding NtrC family response regulator
MKNHPTENRILIIDDDLTTSELLAHYASLHGLNPFVCSSYEAAAKLDWTNFEAALIDLALPDGDGFDLLRHARKHHRDLPCFVLTSLDSADSAVAALKSGAIDYFTKPFDHSRVFSSVRATLPPSRDEPRQPFQQAVEWKSKIMSAAHRSALKAAGNDLPVLIVARPGSGRRAFAQTIHSRSRRAKHPFISVDAAAFDGSGLDLELFGGETANPAGRFVRKRGKIEMCHGGTLFIQEIDRLSLQQQRRLFDMLEQLPEAGQPAWCDFRLIASSRSALDHELLQGSFRSDLFYRLCNSRIPLPCLNEAPEDIPTWCDRLLTEICLRLRKRRPQFSKGAMEAMIDYGWPGNLDQMRQTLETIVTGHKNAIIGLDDLPLEIAHGASGAPLESPPQIIGLARIDDLERASLLAALETCHGNRRRAAKRLGVSLRTIYNMISRHNLQTANSPTTRP